MEDNNTYIIPPEPPSEDVMKSIEEQMLLIEEIKKDMRNILGIKKSDFEKYFTPRNKL